MVIAILYLFPLLVIPELLAAGAVQQNRKDRQQQKSLRSEESEDYFRKWLAEDVVYLISPQEKAVFEKLTTVEEKEQFVEQFWYRRDPDLRTFPNEFKEEHYRRLAYVNERFSSGFPGWMTDRGRIYIIHGPPAEIDSHPTGGAYQRPLHEGGGSTSTYPFEIWRYRHIDGVGEDIELEFVDRSMSGEYRLALNPEEKDALLYVPGGGPTLLEELGASTKADRPYFNPGSGVSYMTRARDNPFTRYETHVMVQAPQQVKYRDLKEIVQVGVSYDQLDFQVRADYVKLNENRVLVPITLEVKNKDLTFELDNDVHVAKVAVYGIVTSITNRIVTEFEDDLVASYRPEAFQSGLEGRSMYQKIIPLDPRIRYRLDLVVKDLHGGNLGVIRRALVPKVAGGENLETSTLILSDYIRLLSETPKEDQMFVLGDVWIRPRIDKVFTAGTGLGVYLQVHNSGMDQATGKPSMTVRYAIRKGSETVRVEQDETGESIQYFSSQRVVLVRVLPLEDLAAGDYRLDVEVSDHIKDETITASDVFSISPLAVAQRQ